MESAHLSSLDVHWLRAGYKIAFRTSFSTATGSSQDAFSAVLLLTSSSYFAQELLSYHTKVRKEPFGSFSAGIYGGDEEIVGAALEVHELLIL